jgi:hypothetical protein
MAINDKAGFQRSTSYPVRESPGKTGILPRKLGCAKGLVVFFDRLLAAYMADLRLGDCPSDRRVRPAELPRGGIASGTECPASVMMY